MNTATRSTPEVTRSRAGWAREGGAGRRYSTARVRQAFQARQRAGWLVALPAAGPRHQQVTALSTWQALAAVVRDYVAGQRLFDRGDLETLLDRDLDSRSGADQLAAAGFGIVGLVGPAVELRATDPRVARYVNRARIGPQQRGYDVHKLLDAFLALPPKKVRRRAVTDDRRIDVALLLRDDWQIDCDDLLDCRGRVRLCSHWCWQPRAQAVAL